jgi:hypothetical protein
VGGDYLEDIVVGFRKRDYFKLYTISEQILSQGV